MSDARVGWLSRAIDGASLLLLVTGSTLYYRAFTGMRELRARAEADVAFVPGTTEAFGYVREFSRLRLTSWIALALAVLGVSVGVYAALHAKQRREQGVN